MNEEMKRIKGHYLVLSIAIRKVCTLLGISDPTMIATALESRLQIPVVSRLKEQVSTFKA